MTIIKRKEIKANEDSYNVISSVFGNGSVAFLADIPKGSIVTGVFVNGKSLEDYCLAEYRNDGKGCSTYYPRGEAYEGQTVAAVYVDETCGDELYSLVFSGGIESFVVEYIETAVSEV